MSSRSTALATDLADDALVGSGDEQQVVGESLEPDGLVEDAGMGGQQVGLLRMSEVHLELGADARERAAELVGRVGHEALLSLSRVVDALEHVVHGASEVGNLIVAGRHRHASVEIAAPDGRYLRTDGLDWAERPADDPPEHRGEDQQHQGEGDHERASKRRDAVLDVVGRRADDDDDVGRLVDQHAKGVLGPREIVHRGGPWRVRRDHRLVVGDVVARRQHPFAPVHDAHDLREGVVVSECRQATRHGLALGGDRVRPQLERLVQRLGEHTTLLHDETQAGQHQHDSDNEGREGGDASSDAEARPHESTSR